MFGRKRARILAALHAAGWGGLTSSELMRRSKLVWWGGFWPSLQRLEVDKVVISRFDRGAYPRMRRYWITEKMPAGTRDGDLLVMIAERPIAFGEVIDLITESPPCQMFAKPEGDPDG